MLYYVTEPIAGGAAPDPVDPDEPENPVNPEDPDNPAQGDGGSDNAQGDEGGREDRPGSILALMGDRVLPIAAAAFAAALGLAALLVAAMRKRS